MASSFFSYLLFYLFGFVLLLVAVFYHLRGKFLFLCVLLSYVLLYFISFLLSLRLAGRRQECTNVLFGKSTEISREKD